MVQTCSAPRQLIRTEKQIIGGAKASSLGLRHRAANVTYRHKFSDILTCNGTREKLIRVQILWNRERSDTYQGWRFPKVYACASAGGMHTPKAQTFLPSSHYEGAMYSAEGINGGMCLPATSSEQRRQKISGAWMERGGN